MGALRFEPQERKDLNKQVAIDLDGLIAATAEVLDERKRLDTNLRTDDEALLTILRVGTSAGGARPKAVVAYNKETGDLRSGQVDAPGERGCGSRNLVDVSHDIFHGRNFERYARVDIAETAFRMRAPIADLQHRAVHIARGAMLGSRNRHGSSQKPKSNVSSTIPDNWVSVPG